MKKPLLNSNMENHKDYYKNYDKKPLSEKRHRNAYEDDEDLDWLYDEKDVAEAVSEFEDSFYSKLRKLGFSTHEESRIIEAHRESEKEIFGEFNNQSQDAQREKAINDMSASSSSSGLDNLGIGVKIENAKTQHPDKPEVLSEREHHVLTSGTQICANCGCLEEEHHQGYGLTDDGILKICEKFKPKAKKGDGK